MSLPILPYLSNLKGYWKLDEGSGSVAIDSSGSGMTGSIVGGVPYTPARVGTGLSFSGSTSQYVDLGNNFNFVNDGVTNFTVGLWVKWNGNTSASTTNLLFTKAISTPNGFYVRIINENTTPQFAMGYAGTTNVSPLTLVANTWYYVVAVNNPTASATIYVNATYSNTVSGNTFPYVSNTVSAAIGNRSDGQRPTFGVIDEVAVWNTAFTYADVLSLYNSYLAPSINVGSTQSITLPTSSTSLTASITLDMSATSSATYSWSVISYVPGNLPTFSNQYSLSTTVSGMGATGTYTFAFTDTDSSGLTGSAQVSVIVTGTASVTTTTTTTSTTTTTTTSAPTTTTTSTTTTTTTAAPGSAITVGNPQVINTFTSNLSSTITAAVNYYYWSQIVGPNTAVFSSTASLSPSLSGLTYGVYQFSFNTTDNTNSHTYNTTWVTVTTSTYPAKSYVILGSSTSAGTGASDATHSYVGMLTRYLQSLNPSTTVTNLAVSGYTTYHILPTGTSIGFSGRPAIDTNANITKALSYNPNVIFINLPANDPVNGYDLVNEIQLNYRTIIASASAVNIPVFVSSAQPRTNGMTPSSLAALISYNNFLVGTYSATDFWTGISNPDGTIISNFDSGDGTHLNDKGHEVLVSRVITKGWVDQVNLTQYPHISTSQNRILNKTNVSITLSGTVSEPLGAILSYTWSQFFGPTVSISSIVSVSPVISGLSNSGTYSFRLSATDRWGTFTYSNTSLYISSVLSSIPVNQSLPYNYVRQHAYPIDSDMVFTTTTQRIAYLGYNRSYEGFTAYDVQDKNYYIIKKVNNSLTWVSLSGSLIIGTTSVAVGGSVSGIYGLSGISTTGDANIGGLVSSSKIQGSSSTPIFTLGSGAGTGGTIYSSQGSDIAGRISMSTGLTPSVLSPVFTVTYTNSYTTSPYVVISPLNASAATSGVYISSGATSFSVVSGVLLSPTSTYNWSYHVIQ